MLEWSGRTEEGRVPQSVGGGPTRDHNGLQRLLCNLTQPSERESNEWWGWVFLAERLAWHRAKGLRIGIFSKNHT